MLKPFVHAILGATLLVAIASPAFATPNTIIFATLYDKGTAAPMAMDHGLGMPNMKMESTMGVRLSTSTAKAGNVTFKVKNSSAETVHELLVFPYTAGRNFPYDDKVAKINEDKAGSLGEVSETEPGKTGELKLSLKPGKYVLLCNVPGHFANGMWSVLTVN